MHFNMMHLRVLLAAALLFAGAARVSCTRAVSCVTFPKWYIDAYNHIFATLERRALTWSSARRAKFCMRAPSLSDVFLVQ